MNSTVDVMGSNKPPDQIKPLILENLPDPPGDWHKGCPRRARLEIDLMLLAIEALDLGGSEALLRLAKDLGLQEIIKNRVVLWRMRSTNPLRRYSQRRPLTLSEAKALVAMVGFLSRRLTALIRQLLTDYQQLYSKQIPVEHHLPLAKYLQRFRVHFRSRMNPKRAGVLAYSSNENLNELALELLSKLLLCTGSAGIQRLWISLFDGEVE
jgi:hypothetical protein